MLSSVLAATHAVVVWEYADLCAALELPGAPHPTGLAVVDASLTEHVVRWHPFRLWTEPADAAGSAGVSVEWGSSSRHPGGRLPVPVADLLGVWRRPVDGELGSVVTMMERAGYRIRWAARS